MENKFIKLPDIKISSKNSKSKIKILPHAPKYPKNKNLTNNNS